MPSTPRPNWHATRIAMARELARRSLCVRDQVAALVVDSNNKVIGEGYNGPPSGFHNMGLPCRNWCRRSMFDVPEPPAADYSDCPSLHAEANALMMSDRSLRTNGAIYVTSHVCHSCAKLIANSGLTLVYVEATKAHAHRRAEASYDFLEECGIKVLVTELVE